MRIRKGREKTNIVKRVNMSFALIWQLFLCWLLKLFVLHTVGWAPPPGDPENEWYPHCPVLSTCRLRPVASFKQSIHLIFGLSLFLLSYVFPSTTVFSKESASASFTQSRTTSLFSFLPPMVFQASFALGPTGSCFCWSRASVELPSDTKIQMNQVFLFYRPSSLSNCCIHTW